MTPIVILAIAIALGLVLGFVIGWCTRDAQAATDDFGQVWPAATSRQIRRDARRNRADLRSMMGDRP